MKKSTLIMILSLVLAVALGVGGTLAYLTDEDGDINVMTVGYVTITQNEQERVEIGNADAGLDEFTQNKPMNPAVFVDYSSKEDVDANGWDVQIRDQVKNYVDKIVSVTNTGANDAYVRTIYAIPEAGDFYSDINSGASDQWLHWNGVSDTDTTVPNGWIWGKDQTTEWPGTGGWDFYNDFVIDIDGEARYYDIFVVTNRDVLKPGETTAPSMVGLYLDPRVDCEVDPTTGEKNYTFVSEDGTKYNLGDISNLKILALSQAVQADGFDNAWDAFDAAFPITYVDGFYDGNSLSTWFEEMVPGTPGDKNDTNNPPAVPTEDDVVVSTWDELKAALDAGEKEIYLEKGVYRAGNVGGSTGYTIPEGTHLIGMGDVMIEGQLGGTLKDVVFENIKFSANYAIYQVYTSGTVSFKNCYFDGYGTYAVNFASTNADVDFKDCVIRGWASMAGGTGSLDFTDCEFIGNGNFCLLRPYLDTTLTNCSFDTTLVKTTDEYPEGIEAAGCTITLNGCTNVNGAIEDLLVSTGDGGYVVQ